MINEYKHGGLKMLDIQTFNRAHKAKWIQKYLDCENHGKQKLVFDAHLDKHGGKRLFSFNLKEHITRNQFFDFLKDRCKKHTS